MNSEQFEIQNATRRSLLNNYKIKSWQQLLARFKFKKACVSSKAAVICFVWIFCIGILYRLASYPGFFKSLYFLPQWIVSLIYAGNAISLCFYPLAGYLADNVVGRYKIIIISLKIIAMTFIVGAALIMAMFLLYLVITSAGQFDYAGYILFMGIIPICVLFYFAINVSFVGFNANVIQFGMEQLHDSPAEHQSTFIYWYVWIYYLVQLVIVQPWNILQLELTTSSCLFGILIISSFVTIIVSLCIAHRKKNWFLINPARINPYKLVYNITRFARQHKVPIQRSAFTYCEDEIPTGLDLAKTKYGGPYTTEDVENVKAFYGILKILLCLCPVFLATFAVDSLYWYVANFQTSSITYHYIFDDSTLSSLIVVILIPIHLFFFRRFKYCYSINMLKRLGIGILFLILTLMSITAFNLPLALVKKECVFTPPYYVYAYFGSNYTYYDTRADWYSEHVVTDIDLKIPPVLLLLPRASYGISNVLLYTALYEFICAQSPPSMKGLIIGLSFAIKGVFQAISAFLLLVFIYFPISHSGSSCSVLYYGMNLLLVAFTLIVYSYFAKKYKYRQRDEICNIYQYAEDYYSKTEEKHL